MTNTFVIEFALLMSVIVLYSLGMDSSSVDYVALIFVTFRYVGAILLGYIILLVILRLSNFYRLSACPSCGNRLKRSKRKKPDRLLRLWSLGILDVKRYRCYACYWEGQAFGIKNESVEDTVE